jgi:hypothetical protein
MAKFIVELMHRDSIATSEPWSLFWLWFTQTMMIAMGWVLVPFNFGPINLWFDDDHPRSRCVVRFLISFIRNQMKQGVINRGEHIALFGDSTTAFSVDKKSQQTFRNMSQVIYNATGVRVWFSSKSGTWFESSYWQDKHTKTWVSRRNGFVEVADDFHANKTWNNWMINHVLLVGGWNLKDDITEEFIVPFITEFDTRVNEMSTYK